VQAAKPNPTQAVPIHKVITDKPIIKVPGCPPIAEVMTGVITYMLTFDRIPSWTARAGRRCSTASASTTSATAARTSTPASSSRPGTTTPRARLLPVQGRLQGPDHLQRLLDGALERRHSFPIQAGHGCIGCSEDGFWDKGSFYDRLTHINQFGVEANADKIGGTAAVVLGAAAAAHAAASAIQRVSSKRDRDGR
jgi:hydrogenase small subunit